MFSAILTCLLCVCVCVLTIVKHTEQDAVGPDVEPLVHEGEHVHGKEAGNKTRNKVRYQDIIDLGLRQELLKGDLVG